MPITFSCPCGKSLRVADEHAGRRIKCPACQSIATAPQAEPMFEVVEDEPEAPPPPKARPVAKPAAKPTTRRDDEDDEDGGFTVVKSKDEDDEDDRPRKKPPNFRKGSGRRDEDEDDDDEDDRPRKKKRKKKPAAESSDDGSANGSIGLGILMILGAIVWFVVGIVALDRIFFYPPILFVFGLIAFFKGLASRG